MMGKTSLGVSHMAMPQPFSLDVYSGLNSKSQPFSGNWPPKASLPFAVIATVLTPEK